MTVTGLMDSLAGGATIGSKNWTMGAETAAAAEGRSVLVSHLIGGKIHHAICRRRVFMSTKTEPKSCTRISVFEAQ